jgi:predicted transcriptional regulator
VLKPIDKEEPSERRAAREASVANLASRIAACRPKSVVAIAKCIDKYVKDAWRRSKVDADYHCVSFPGNGRQGRFQTEMEKLLLKLPISA